MTEPLKPDANEDIFRLLETRTGLLLDANRRLDVAGVIRELCESSVVSSTAELVAVLTSQPITHPVWQRLTQSVTIGETYFFRYMSQFDALRHHVLPYLIEERRQAGNKQLRLWSAACATGEEPYSLAILLRELLPDIDTWSISLLATDINEAFLEQARRGIYRERSFRGETPATLRDRWFTPVKEGHLLDAQIRQMVVFRTLNLQADDYPSFESGTMHMDIILCRNVTIYFERETTRQIIGRFLRSLNDNRWLVVGHAEPQFDLYTGFTAENFENTVFYHKRPAPLAQPDRPPAAPAFTPYSSKIAVNSIKTQLTAAPAMPDKVTTDENLLERAKDMADHERWDEALSWLDKAEVLGRFEPQVHYLRGLIALNTGDMEQGLQHLRRAVYCDHNFALAHYMLGELYEKQGWRQNAVRHWRWALHALAEVNTHYTILFGDDLTVEMLQELLTLRLTKV